jgi:hypothetical protein
VYTDIKSKILQRHVFAKSNKNRKKVKIKLLGVEPSTFHYIGVSLAIRLFEQ